MKNIITTVLGVFALTISLAGCGESYTGTYTGQATVRDGCPPAAFSGSYDIDLRVQISGEDASFLITRFVKSGTNSVPSNSGYATKTVNTKFNDTSFYQKDFQAYSDDPNTQVDLTAYINAGRDEITSYAYVLNHKLENGSVCQYRIDASKLTRKS
jgi:hypothetical protein